MKICVISDLHGNLPKISEQCELVLICGDLIPLNIQNNIPKSKYWFRYIFSEWVNSLLCDKVFAIAGNHDRFLESIWNQKQSINKYLQDPTNGKLVYLENECITYISNDNKIYTIFGTPFCKIFGNWSFMQYSGDLEETFEKIPLECDILLSHDAPFGVSDILLEPTPWGVINTNHIGNFQLTQAVLERDIKYLFHGHLHSTNHECELLKNTKVYNTSILNEKYEETYKPLYLEI